MNVYSFMEINIDSQVEELRLYFNEKGAEISVERSSKGLEDDLHKIIGVCDTNFNSAEVNENEVESTLNYIVSVLMVMPLSEKTESLIVAFCEKLSKAPQSRNLGPVALRVLNVLFHGLPENLGMRYHIYYTMIQVSGQIGQVAYVFKDVDNLKNTLKGAQPPPSTEQMQQLLRLLHQTLLANNMGYSTVPEQCVYSTVPEQCVYSTVPEHCVYSTVPEHCVYSTVPEHCVYSTVPEHCVYSTVPEQCVYRTIPEQCVYSKVPKKCVYSKVPKKCVYSTVPEQYHL
ncbi:hypothetical protein FHG87_014187 [Trinorchestia longiramus]|nr:hypothetical protein FHG87_014187 [Trinorchestia longiramus]